MSFKIGVIGTGYVGLVSGTCFAESGNQLICVDIDEQKIAKLNSGGVPIYEPGLDVILQRNIRLNRIKFTSDITEAIRNCEIIFLCLPTPPNEDGSADLGYVLAVTETICNYIESHSITDRRIIVNRSTVPVGTADKVKAIVQAKTTNKNIHVVSNPEFLAEGFAVEESLNPSRVVVGTSNAEIGKVMQELYEPFLNGVNKFFLMDERSAEVTKYAANSFLAMRISFMNDLSNYCELNNVNIDNVKAGIGSDPRVGPYFLNAGIGYGGSCFPKDVRALLYSSEEINATLTLIRETQAINQKQIQRFISKVTSYFQNDFSNKTIAIWGLAFKPDTDDIREAPSFAVIRALLELSANLHVYDPEAMENTKLHFGDSITYFPSMYDAVRNADALIVCTEWKEFKAADVEELKKLMKNSVIFDGRNIFDLTQMKELGFHYASIGRPLVSPN